MAKFEIIPGLYFVDRKGWKARKSYPRLGRKVARSRRTHVIIHHTVVTDNDDTPNIWSRETSIFANMRRLQVIREQDLGADVPYNFVVYFAKKKQGIYVCEGRGEDRTGAHTKGHNTEGIGIALAGNLEDSVITGQEIAKRMYFISAFIGWLKYNASHRRYGSYKPMRKLGSLHPADRKVFIHRDFKNTACPGKKLLPHLSTIDYINPANYQ